MTVQAGLCLTWLKTPKTGFLTCKGSYHIKFSPGLISETGELLCLSWVHKIFLCEKQNTKRLMLCIVMSVQEEERSFMRRTGMVTLLLIAYFCSKPPGQKKTGVKTVS